MALPPDALAEVERYCQSRGSEEIRIEPTVRGKAITIVERRPPWREDFGAEWSTTRVAQLRYDGRLWTLYCSDSNDRWWLYDHAPPADRVAPLLGALDEDATGIFWG
jgi:hypothetical protein